MSELFNQYEDEYKNAVRSIEKVLENYSTSTKGIYLSFKHRS